MSRVGGLIIGLQGYELTHIEQQWLQHPLVVGVILFTRNYKDKNQLIDLTKNIREINSNLLISVDHEGGRVQRFREGFTCLPPMNTLEEVYHNDPKLALRTAYSYGKTIATELASVGVDFTYAPVCDINYGNNDVIGDRAFHSDPVTTSLLVQAFYLGLRSRNSIGVAKHFPGHGYVAIDTHLGLAVDDRPLLEIIQNDILPFKTLIEEGIEAIMPSHIIYKNFDDQHTAISSPKWINYLRSDLGFDGLIISDDLDMKGAEHLGSVVEKSYACFDAGVDLLLCCNDFTAIETLLSTLQNEIIAEDTQQRLDFVHTKLA
ncbi:beta-N-acetylhexosaminidase [Wohlfahrtiimonas larvae]|uniref:beta-N-acetylhexosaminidase n=1 Tax=Wohlfahrtiimonas larvae TaxID=1157986 RepID=A0ABP9MIH3_9GAMM|nr:beta-N-acetylhexosaminidase [Wohlfahrtiimonas larvae]